MYMCMWTVTQCLATENVLVEVDMVKGIHTYHCIAVQVKATLFLVAALPVTAQETFDNYS